MPNANHIQAVILHMLNLQDTAEPCVVPNTILETRETFVITTSSFWKYFMFLYCECRATFGITILVSTWTDPRALEQEANVETVRWGEGLARTPQAIGVILRAVPAPPSNGDISIYPTLWSKAVNVHCAEEQSIVFICFDVQRESWAVICKSMSPLYYQVKQFKWNFAFPTRYLYCYSATSPHQK